MGKILDELLEKARKLQGELDTINAQIRLYQENPEQEKIDHNHAISHVMYDAINTFIDDLLWDGMESDTSNSEPDILYELLEKYMISHKYTETIEDTDYFRPAHNHSYTFHMKDFELYVKIRLVRGHDGLESSIDILPKGSNLVIRLDEDDEHIYNKIKAAPLSANLPEEVIKEYCYIFNTINMDKFVNFERFAC